MIPRRPHRIPPLALALALATLVVSACEKAPFLAPSGSTITLTSATTALPVNGTATLTAQVLEAAGTPPHSGTRVTLTTTLGTIEPSEVSTDAGGRATVTFRAGGASGVAIIAASSGGATTSGGAPTTTTGGTGGTTSGSDRNLRIAVGAAAVGRIVLGASPSTISALGGTSNLTAAVTDINGNPLPAVPVIFTTTAGALASSSVVSDAIGLAVTTLTTSVEATVTASAGLNAGSSGGTGGTGGSGGTGGGSTTGGSSSATVTVRVNPVPTLSITPSTTGTLTAGSPIVFTITATIPTGSTAQIREMSVDFGDGSVRPLGAANGTTTVQHVYNNTNIQSYTVTVNLLDTLGARTSASTVIVVLPQPPLAATIAFTKASGGTDTTVSFNATVSPATATVVSYFWDFGDGTSATTTANQTTHAYPNTPARVYQVRVRVTTTTGQTTDGTAAVGIP